MPHLPEAAELLEAAESAHRAEDLRELERVARELIALCEDAGDPRLAHGHLFLGIARARLNDAPRANENCQRALDLFSAAGDKEGVLRAKVAQAMIAGEVEPDPALAHRLSLEALLLARELGSDHRLAVTLGNYAEVCRQEGDYKSAVKHADEAATLFVKCELFARAAAQHTVIAQIYADRRNYEQAVTELDRAWELLTREPIARHFAWYFEVWVIIAVALGQYETAAKLYGFANHQREVNDALRLQGLFGRLSAPIERLFANLDSHHAEELVEIGSHLSLEEVHALTESIRLNAPE